MARKKPKFSSPEEFQQYVVDMLEIQFKLLARVESIATQGAEASLTAKNCLYYAALLLLHHGLIRIDREKEMLCIPTTPEEDKAVIKKVFGLND